MNNIHQIYPELMTKVKKDLTANVKSTTKEIRENTESILTKGIILYIALNIFLFIKKWTTISIVLFIITLFFPLESIGLKNMLLEGYAILFQ